MEKKEAISMGCLGNMVDLLECLVNRISHPVETGDQTSLHNPWLGGYMPVGMSFENGRQMIINDPHGFKNEVQKTLRKHDNM